MEFNKKIVAIVVCLTLVIAAGTLAVLNGSSHKGSSNSIEIGNVPETSPDKTPIAKFEKGLNTLLTQGYLDATTKDIVLAAGVKYDAERSREVSADSTQDITLTALKANGLITANIYDQVKSAIEKKAASDKNEKFQPLLASGAFSDIDTAEKGYLSFVKQLQEKTTEERNLMNKEIEASTPPMTDAQKQEKKDAYKARRDQRIEEVLSVMVSAKEITKAQSDALNSFVTKKKVETTIS